MNGSLHDLLAAELAGAGDVPLLVAYSGGPDSTALLHALAHQSPRPRLRVLHIDHGLHAESGLWSMHCRRFCESLDIPFESIRVAVDLTRGEGMEGAARRARRDAFGSALRQGERLVLAHHRDDQAETVLLKLMRGAGPEGLAGMRALRSLGAGLQWRPLLHVPRETLLAHVALHGLDTIHDPSNDDPRVARAWLRGTVMPALREHWPHAAHSLIHSARLCAEAADALQAQWQAALIRLRRPDGTLDVAGWLALLPALRAPLLDQWLHEAGLQAPTTAQRAALEHQAREAAAHRVPCVAWRDTEVHVWRGALWARRRRPLPPSAWEGQWTGAPMALPGGGMLRMTVSGAVLPSPLVVRYRQGGETLRPVGSQHTRDLRLLFQEGGVPPWLRPRIPLLWAGHALVAVAGYWISAAGADVFAQAGGEPAWDPEDAGPAMAVSDGRAG